MSWLSMLFIAAGLALDIFASVSCQGALVAKIQKRRLAIVVTLITVWQTAIFFVGAFLGNFLLELDMREYGSETMKMVACAILIVLGIRMFWKAKKDDFIDERRVDEIHYMAYVKMLMVATWYTFLTGFSVGLLAGRMLMLLPIVAIVTAVFVTFGIYTGYRFGFEQKTKAYIVGGILLLIASADLVIEYIGGESMLNLLLEVA